MNSQEAVNAILEGLERDDDGLFRDENDSEFSDNIIPDPVSQNDEYFSEEEINNTNTNCILSKDGEIWSQNIPHRARANTENIIKFKEGFTKNAFKQADTPLKAFTMFVDNDILKVIFNSTNSYIDYQLAKCQKISTENSLKFIGASQHIGLMKSKNMDAREFWSKKYGQSIIYESISLKLFETISANQRFDSRNSRNKNDKLASIFTVWDMFIHNCQKNYVPSEQVTIDERLITFRGRCSFKMFIPSKPGRYGIKVWAICGSKNVYLYNAKVYIGKKNGRVELNQEFVYAAI